MSFQTAKTIREVIESIDKRKYFLPAIQREFVWKPFQIERLFDSLMKDYPISSFLFWEVENDNIKDYQFYEFVREYHERDNRYNEKTNLNIETGGITAILDGQQRLTSLYIGLLGSYAYKVSHQRWNNPLAFPKRKLCLNLLSPSTTNDDLDYDFKFLTEEEIKDDNEKHKNKKDDNNSFWYVVGDVLKLQDTFSVNKYLAESRLVEFEFSNQALFKLWQIINIDKTINFFLEKDKSLDKVLNIFIRVNSGGTQLSYSDLLLSVATAQWKEKDAREVITKRVEDLNKIGNGFNVNKDFVLKSCLVLSGLPIAFKVNNFTKDNMLHIESEWENISKAIEAAVLLVSSFGYNRETLTSNNALIPIALYLYKIRIPNNFIQSETYKDDRRKIAKWLAIALLKGTFGGQPDSVLTPIRDVINKTTNGFPFDKIVERLKLTKKAMSFNDDEIENLFYYQYKQDAIFPVLVFIYPDLNFNNKFEQDHIFPKCQFTTKKLSAMEISEDKRKFYLDNYNCLANVQLLPPTVNAEKLDKDFEAWITEQYPVEKDRKSYMERNYIPDVDFSIKNFDVFIEKRKELITAAFKKLLGNTEGTTDSD